MIKRLVIGSKNKAKINEWSKFLGEFVSVAYLKEFGEIEEVEETGSTFAENARLKASHYAKKLNEFVFSEDGGFEIDYLGGLPGVKSKRILGGKEATDQQIVEYFLEKLKDVPSEERTARLKVHAVITDPNGNILFEDSTSIEGVVAQEIDRAHFMEGYPYRSLLFIPEINKSYAQASDEENIKVNHKKIIANKIREFLVNYR